MNKPMLSIEARLSATDEVKELLQHLEVLHTKYEINLKLSVKKANEFYYKSKE